MSGKIHVADISAVRRFGKELEAAADDQPFLDERIIATYQEAVERFSSGVDLLASEGEKLQREMAEAGDGDGKEGLSSQIERLEQRMAQARCGKEEAERLCKCYRQEAQDLQEEFAQKARAVGSALIAFADELERAAGL